MALAPRDIPLTREQVRNAIIAFKRQSTYPTLRSYLEYRVDQLKLPDRMVDVADRDDFNERQLDLVDYLLEDVRSYSVAESLTDGQIS